MPSHLPKKLFALIGVVCIAFLQFTDRTQRPDFSDFKVYWVAGAKAAAHQTVYDVEGHYQFKYSPFIALLWSVPHLVGGARYRWAAAHYLACALGFLLLWYLCARLLDRERSLWLWLLAVLTFSVGLRDELKLGQANLWPLLLVLPAWQSAARPRDKLDLVGLAIGAAWSFAVQWKLYALVLAPVWLLRRRASVFVGAIVFSLASLWGALSLAHGADFAVAENSRWLSSLTASSEELLVSQYNVSALGILGKWGGHVGIPLGIWAYALWLLLAVGWGLVLLWAELAARNAATTRSPYLIFWSTSWAWAAIVILNPLVWPYWLNFCLPLFLMYVHQAFLATASDARMTASAVLVASLFMFANWLQNSAWVHQGFSFIAVCALLFDAQRRMRRRDLQQLPQLSALYPGAARPHLRAESH